MYNDLTSEEMAEHAKGNLVSPKRFAEATSLYSTHFYTGRQGWDWGIGVYAYGESPFKLVRPKTEEWLKANPWFMQGFEAVWERNKDWIAEGQEELRRIEEEHAAAIRAIMAQYS